MTGFVSVAVGPYLVDPHETLWEAVYAVAGDHATYRFSVDLEPDGRVEVAS